MISRIRRKTAVSGMLLCLVPLLPPAAAAQSAAPADIPRLHDGKPDFNGIWDRPRVSNVTLDSEGCGAASNGCSAKGSGPLAFTPEGLAQHNAAKFDYTAHCLPWGYLRANQTSYPVEYVQTADRFVILFESNNVFHTVPTDGRQHPDNIEPTWMGKSVGRYEGDTLVIDTRGFNGQTWLDVGGEHPSSDALHLVERIRHIDADTLEYHLTIEDPKYYTKPIENTRIFVRMVKMPNSTSIGAWKTIKTCWKASCRKFRRGCHDAAKGWSSWPNALGRINFAGLPSRRGNRATRRCSGPRWRNRPACARCARDGYAEFQARV